MLLENGETVIDRPEHMKRDASEVAPVAKIALALGQTAASRFGFECAGPVIPEKQVIA
jgi:hypothetical protein